MGLVKGLGRMQSFGKKHCRSLYWRIRAAMEKTTTKKKKANKQHLKFHYDPYSYALNFDDGFQDTDHYNQRRKSQPFPEFTIWVCVVLPKWPCCIFYLISFSLIISNVYSLYLCDSYAIYNVFVVTAVPRAFQPGPLVHIPSVIEELTSWS